MFGALLRLFTPLPTLHCPCCLTLVAASEVDALEVRVGGVPWGLGWSNYYAREGRLQWACRACVTSGRAVHADPTRQRFHRHPPFLAYFDITKTCEDCREAYVFTRSEQVFWYEERKFLVESRPIACAPCRKARRRRNGALQAYEAKLAVLDKTDAAQWLELAELLEVAGRFERATEYRNRARKLMPPLR
jgi:hypothetical protein